MEQKPDRTEGSPSRKPRLQFVLISDPDDSKSKTSRRVVRSHAARESQIRARQDKSAQLQLLAPSAASSPSHSYSGTPESVATAPSPPDEGQEYRKHWQRSLDLRDPQMEPTIPSLSVLLTANAVCGSSDSLDYQISPFEHFLIDHYVTIPVPVNFVDCSTREATDRRNDCLRNATRELVYYSVHDPGLMCCLLLVSSRNLSLIHTSDTQRKARLEQVALHYKTELVKAVSEAIDQEGRAVSTSTISKVLTLAFDDAKCGDVESLKRHIQAIKRMVELVGGRQAPCLNGWLRAGIDNLLDPEHRG